ncbi:MAG: serine/threonine-protein kinase [Candidatus Obscuribacterales bacterium]|nr:serine/threonine-protein kinase [Candidatus Obscuribacterales bacterium]
MALENPELKDDSKRNSTAIGIGAIIKNRYQVVAYLGRGGMSTVYKALDMSTGKTVALKILHAELLSDTTRVQRFEQEAKTYRNLRHDHIVKTYDFFTDETSRYCLVMEYHEGRNLSELLADSGRLTVRRAIKVFSEICSALDHAHSQGIVHRDLKPSNIALVEKDSDVDFVKVLDFGIAKLMPRDEETQLGLTQTGEIVGSPLYMSPEQCMAKPIDHRSDIYSLGCLMYEALTGRPPLIGGNVYETFHMQTNDRPAPLGDVRPEFKGGTQFEFIIFKCMAKNPRHRYQTMLELRQALEQVGTYSVKSGLSQLAESFKQRRIKERAAKSKGIPAVVAAALTAVVLVLVGAVFHDRIRQIIIPADQRFKHAIAEYRKAFNAGEYETADQEARSALRVADEERHEWLIPALTNVIDLDRIRGRIKDAEKLNARIDQINDGKVKAIAKNEKTTFAKLKSSDLESDEDVEKIEDYCFQLCDLAQVYSDSRRYADAKSLLKRTLQFAKQSLGAKSLVVAALVDNLALLRLKDNLDEKYDDLERQLLDAVENRTTIAGGESTGLIRTLEALSEVQRRMGNYEDARTNALKALSIARNAFRSSSAQAAVTKCQVAEVDLSRGKPSAAASIASTALASMDVMKESDDLEEARCHILLGEAKIKNQKFSDASSDLNQAEELLKEGADSQVLLLARAYVDLADIQSHQAKQSQNQEGFKSAEGLYKRALALMYRSPAREESVVLSVLEKLRTIYEQSSRAGDSLELYKVAELVDKSTGKKKGVVEDLRLIGSYFLDQRNLPEATRSLEQALSISQTFYGLNGSNTCALLGLLADTYLKDKKLDKAAPLLYEANQIIRSEKSTNPIPREVKVQVLSTYVRYFEATGDKGKAEEIKNELDSV